MANEEAEARTKLEHHFLDCAKSFLWTEVQALLDETPDLINVQPSGRWSALHQAACEGNSLMVSDLLARRADPAARTRDGKSPLDITRGRGEAFELLKNCRGKETATAGDPQSEASAPTGREISVSAFLTISGDKLGDPIKCQTLDTVEDFAQALRKQDPAGGKFRYTFSAEGKKLEPKSTLERAGVEDGSSLGVVRGECNAVEVPTMEELWEQHPGTRYPVTISRKLPNLRFYGNPDCLDEDEVRFGNTDFGGGYARTFVNKEGKPSDGTSRSYIL